MWGIRVTGAGNEKHGKGLIFVACCEYMLNADWGEISGCDFEGPWRSYVTDTGQCKVLLLL